MAKITIKAIKQRLTKQLGIISDVDQYHFELLLNSWNIYLTAVSEIETNGITIKTSQRIFVNPAVMVRNECWKQIKTLSEQFGIKPISRDGTKDIDEDDDIAGMLD